jgi:tetraacyldisaccharide 4'-kinase
VTARRGWAWPLVPLYAAALAAKDGMQRAGLLRTRRLTWPVISVGSLSAGGAGKTPAVIALAQLLRERGWAADVLSRGYGRTGSRIEQVDADAEDAADRFGDEPVMIARRAAVPVWVGAERYAAGVMAEAAAAEPREADSPVAPRNGNTRRVHLLDDGFQHRRLARSINVVLVTAEDLDDALLPAGNRREPLRALGRADAVVVREEERQQVEARLRRWMRPGAAMWTVRRRIDLGEATGAFDREAGFLGFCAIARPQGFLRMLKDAGARVVDSVLFPDHHRYTVEDMQRLIAVFQGSGAGAFVTTEKDAVKITPRMRALLEASAPLLVARLHVEFVDPDAVARELEARIS